MSTDKDGTQAWHYTPNPNDIEGEEPKYLGLLTWFSIDGQEQQSEVDVDLAVRILADHRKAVQADALAAALAGLTRMISRHRAIAIYGYEKMQYVIDDNEHWQLAEAALARYASNPTETGK